MPNAKPSDKDESISEQNAAVIEPEEVEDTSAQQDEQEAGNEVEPIQEDEQLEVAVDDITKKESDTVLAAEDAELSKAFDKPPAGWKAKLKDLFDRWWNNKKLRYGTFAGLGALFFLLLIIPPTRYFILNSVGVRASMSINVYDDSTHYPLKNVLVTASGQSAKTDSNGLVRLQHVKLGRQDIKIQKRAFAETKKTVTLGWGSNPLGNIDIKPIGTQYTYYLTDWLTGKPIQKGAVSSGEFDANVDKDGKAVLTVDASDEEVLTVTIKSPGYRDEQVKQDLSNKTKSDIKMVSSRKVVFVSKRSGKYDLYKIDADGKNESLVLAGSGNESVDITLVSHPTDEVAALVSTRDNVRNKDGYLLSTLTLVDLHNNDTSSVAHSESIQVIGWSGDRLVYVQIAAGASAANAKRQRLISYNYKTNEKTELASGNSFNDLVLIGNNVYYAPGNYYTAGAVNNFYRQNVDGANRTSLLAKEVWNIFRTTYNQLDLSVGQDWYRYKVGDSKADKQGNAPASLYNRIYNDSPDGKHSLWIDERDGKGTLLLYDIEKGTDKVLKQQAGLEVPLRWLDDNTLLYRIHTQQETADYVMNVNGGEAKKVKDVTATHGIGAWYH